MAERQFTDNESSFLKHFFTGVDELAGIYTAKSTLSPQIWAFLAGAYSRSTLTMREKLLATLHEIVTADVASRLSEDCDVEGAVALMYDSWLLKPAQSADEFTSILARAEKFLEKWAVDYGHSSLKDSCYDRFAVENISIRATKFVERFTLGAYQEKSTRYVDFSKVEPILSVFGDAEVLGHDPKELAAELHRTSIDLYADILSRATAHYLKAADANTPTGVAERVAKASAFDVARYVLMVNLPTSLGVTAPSRETERMIKFLRGHALAELNDIGARMQAAAVLTNPALIKHVQPRETIELDASVFVPLHEYTAGISNVARYADGEVTVTTTSMSNDAHPRWLAAAALLSFVGSEQIEDLHATAHSVKTHTEAEGTVLLQELWKTAFAGIGPHDEFPEVLDNVYIHFDGVLDFGAYRDLQRHRNGYQPDVRMQNDRGYSVPDLLEDVGFEDLLERYHELLTQVSFVRGSASPAQAEYFNCLGHNVLFSYSCSLAQALYIIRLRTGAAGHESYRSFTQSLAAALTQAIPEIKPVLQVDWSKKTDRTAAELRAARRREHQEN